MSCLCGDTNCPSCGPAQGHDPVFELILEAMAELAEPDGDEEQDGCDKLVIALSQFPRIAKLLEVLANAQIRKKTLVETNILLDSIKPCKKHDTWPDSEYGCIECLNEEIGEE